MNNRLKSVVFRVEYNQDQPAKAKGRGKAKDYNFFAKYPSLVKAKEAIDSGIDQNFWVRSVKRSTKEGNKIYFTCAGFPKCPRFLYILLDCETNDADVFVSTDEHDHYSDVTLPKTIDRESKALVIELNEYYTAP